MPHTDPEKQKAAQRDSMRKKRAGGTVAQLAEKLKDHPDLPEPPSREQILRVLGVQAMNGHVTAARTLLEEYRRDGNSDTNETSPLAAVHDLARRRQQRA